jgi:lysozyme
LNYDRQRLLEQLKQDEESGVAKLTSYVCPAGHITIGYGHNLEAHPDLDYPAVPGTTCTLEQAEAWLESDVDESERLMVQRWPWMADLPSIVYENVLNMVFNMGVATFACFINTLRALQSGSWGQAAYELEHSKWYLQVGARAKRIVATIENARG